MARRYNVNVAPLGSGATSIVYRATIRDPSVDISEREVAIKKICLPKLAETLIEYVYQEIDILRSLNHPHVTSLLDEYQENDPEGRKTLCLVLELADTDMKKYLRSHGILKEEEALIYMKQIVNAFYYLHHSNILHRDMKPENLLMQQNKQTKEWSIKIADFGFSSQRGKTDLSVTRCGTILYQAPEVYFSKAYEVDGSTDLWSLGVILYKMITGNHPLCGRIFNNEKLLRDNLVHLEKGRYKIPLPSTIQPEGMCAKLIRRLLVYEPKKRMNMQELFHFFGDEFHAELVRSNAERFTSISFPFVALVDSVIELTESFVMPEKMNIFIMLGKDVQFLVSQASYSKRAYKNLAYQISSELSQLVDRGITPSPISPDILLLNIALEFSKSAARKQTLENFLVAREQYLKAFRALDYLQRFFLALNRSVPHEVISECHDRIKTRLDSITL